MKRVIFIVLSLFAVFNINTKSQIKIEAGVGYLFELPNQNVFPHTSEGWQINGSLVYNLAEVFELKSTLSYQSRRFDPNSFQFISPDVVGYPELFIKGGDNLNSIGMYVGGRLIPISEKIVKPILSADFGLNYFQDGFYDIEYVGGTQTMELKQPTKYFESKFLFESSVGLGFLISPVNSLSIIVEAKANYLPSEKTIYFPIITNLRINI